jgi:hypothetical protein
VNDYDPTNPDQALRGHPESSATPPVSATGSPPDPAPPSSPPPASSPDLSGSVATGNPAHWARVRRLLSKRKAVWIMAAAVLGSLGLSIGLTASPSASATQTVATTRPAGGPLSGGGGSNARSGPAAGGSVGTVTTTSKSSFTLTTSAGQKVTVNESSSTKYQKKGKSASASAVTKGERVLVVGTTSGTTIKATQVIVQTGSATTTNTSAQVVPFQQGAPSTAKTIGQIPANYSQGSGTIVSGTAATKATEAALAAYPGGVVDRVVKLSNGEYEVHNIGVNWPHHVFVNQNFKVVGAN